MRILNSAQMREADRRTSEELGIPSTVLMENAGRQVVSVLESRYPDLVHGRMTVLCGTGNNGGDGFVAGRTLLQEKASVAVFIVGRISDISGDARLNLESLGRLGVPIVEITHEQDWELHATEVFEADIIIDALFGTGLRAPLTGLLETVVADVNASGLPIVSVDLPSGLSADVPAPIGPSVEATLTVTFARPKYPLVLPPAETRVGELVVADIGIPDRLIDTLSGPEVHLLTRASVRELIKPRSPDSHKGDYGHVLIVAGSIGKSGAAHLAAMGALRSGAGLVTVACPRSIQPVVAAMAPEYMTLPLDDRDGVVTMEAADELLRIEHDVLAVGPGLGRGPAVTAFVTALLERTAAPVVLDADALNAFADMPERLVAREGVDIIVTPHPGEMARLLEVNVQHVQESRIDVARDFARRRRMYVVLKGHRTLIATPAGWVFVNSTGNPGMATGGTGDVLTGTVAAWLGQLLDAEAACKLGVYLHGTAGDLAHAACGEVAMTAGDLVDCLGAAVLSLFHPQPPPPDDTMSTRN